MRLRNKPWAADVLNGCPYYTREPSANRGRWKDVFGNCNPIWLEIGCGKGFWLAGTAPLNPDINFIGADIKGLVLAYSIRLLDDTFMGSMNVLNVHLLSLDAERIREAFAPEDNIERIIINFCNPWTKPQHKKRRLVHTRQLVQYRQFLADDGEIIFKTDSDELFADSPAYFAEAGFEILEITDDYYATHDKIISLMTEHERKFTEMGLPIHYIRAKKKAEA